MKKVVYLLVFLISSIPLTGIAFIDGMFWDAAFYVLGLISYSVVGVLFTVGLLTSKKAGSDAYFITFVILIVVGYLFYKLLELIRNWILSWPLFVRILIPSLIILCIFVKIVFVVRDVIISKQSREKAMGSKE